MAKSILYSFARRRAVDAAIDLACGDVDDERAFRRLVDSVRLVMALQLRGPRPPLTAIPFGARKGQSLATLSVDELRRLEAWARRALEDPARRTWRAANARLLQGLELELGRRRNNTGGAS